jgi:hypothetical protein
LIFVGLQNLFVVSIFLNLIMKPE